MEKQQREQVDRNIREAKEKLEAEMEAARHEHQLMLMRQGKRCTTNMYQYFVVIVFLEIGSFYVYQLTLNLEFCFSLPCECCVLALTCQLGVQKRVMIQYIS